MSIVRDFIQAARKGGLFDESRFPWLDEAKEGEWPYRELKWVWCHPVLFVAAVVWPILCAIIVVGVENL